MFLVFKVMRIFLLFIIYVLICDTVETGITKNDKLPEVETTVDGKFIITYPNNDQQKPKAEPKNDAFNHPSLIPPKTSITNLKDKKMPIMPNIGPLTAYGHPSTRYKSIDRDVKTVSSAESDSMLHEENSNDSDPDPFASQRKIRPFLVPDAYAAAPIELKSSGIFLTSTEKIPVAEKLPITQTSNSVPERLETFSTTSKESISATTVTTQKEIVTTDTVSTVPNTVPPSSATLHTTTPQKIITTKTVSTEPTSTTPETATAEKLTKTDSVSIVPLTVPSTIPSSTSHQIITTNTVSTISSTTPEKIITPATVSTVPPKVPSSTSTLKTTPSSPTTSLSPTTNTNNLPQNIETNETSAELLNKETFNGEGSDYDNDVFARLKDDVELMGDNPRSFLSESIPRPTLVHPRKSNKFFRRQFAAPSEDREDVEEEEVEVENKEDIIPEVAFPLPNCYRTAGGFLCCNRFLEELIYRSNSVIERKKLSECNIHAFAAHLQTEAEKMFKTTFEIVIGTGDFASKSRFKDNLICKTIANKKVILIYGTPEPYSVTTSNTPLSFT